MVFLSTCQVILGRNLSRSVFSFGTRRLTQRVVVEEIATGLAIVLPLSLMIALWTKRAAASGWLRPRFVRRDVWTTLVITMVGDLFLELLLPSLQCLPTQHPFDVASSLSYFDWLQQAWGFNCPEHEDPDFVDRSLILSTDAVGTLLTVRLIFMCLGVYLGETFCPIALTGGIASGKSTVVSVLSHVGTSSRTSGSGGGVGGGGPHSPSPQSTHTSKRASWKRSTKHAKKPKSAQSLSDSTHLKSKSPLFDDEGSFLIIDTDKIAHQILLPPSVLPTEQDQGAGGGSSSYLTLEHDDDDHADDDYNDDEVDDDDDDDDETEKAYTPMSLIGGGTAIASSAVPTKRKRRSRRRDRYIVTAADSVYYRILEAFGDESDNYRNILTTDNLIDREKLGALVFSNKTMRRKLNSITHPRIFVTMMKHLIHGSFFSSHDVVCADIPLFFETMSSLRRMFGLVIVVACPRDVQFQRLRKRNPELTVEQCWDRINSQMPISDKVAQADMVIWNNGDLAELEQEVERVRREVIGRIYGIGMSLLQMLLLVGGSLSLAVSSKLFASFSV